MRLRLPVRVATRLAESLRRQLAEAIPTELLSAQGWYSNRGTRDYPTSRRPKRGCDSRFDTLATEVRMATVGRNPSGLTRMTVSAFCMPPAPKVAEYSNLGLRDATLLGLPILQLALWVFEVC